MSRRREAASPSLVRRALHQRHILTINAGSSSVKFALFSVDVGAERLVASGQADGLGAAPRFRTRIAGGEDSEDANIR